MHNRNFDQFEFQNTQMPKTPEGWRMLKVGCFIILGVFLMGLLAFYLFFHVMMNGANKYEDSFTTLKGVFETTDSVRAPISGKMTNVAQIDVHWYCWSAGEDDYDSYFSFLDFKPGTILNVNGKKIKIVGDQVHRFSGKKDYNTVSRLSMQSLVSGTPDTVPNVLIGLDRKLDEHIRRFKSGDFIMGANCRLSLSEFCYSTTDTVTIRAHVRNDTIFLENDKY